jgi:hypothetical protein
MEFVINFSVLILMINSLNVSQYAAIVLMHATVEIILLTMNIIISDVAIHTYILIREVHSPQ